MKPSFKHIAILFLASAFLALSTGCATVRGIGRDVGTAGEGIEKSTR
jgi:predicted small secreted protein